MRYWFFMPLISLFIIIGVIFSFIYSASKNNNEKNAQNTTTKTYGNENDLDGKADTEIQQKPSADENTSSSCLTKQTLPNLVDDAQKNVNAAQHNAKMPMRAILKNTPENKIGQKEKRNVKNVRFLIDFDSQKPKSFGYLDNFFRDYPVVKLMNACATKESSEQIVAGYKLESYSQVNIVKNTKHDLDCLNNRHFGICDLNAIKENVNTRKITPINKEKYFLLGKKLEAFTKTNVVMYPFDDVIVIAFINQKHKRDEAIKKDREAKIEDVTDLSWNEIEENFWNCIIKEHDKYPFPDPYYASCHNFFCKTYMNMYKILSNISLYSYHYKIKDLEISERLKLRIRLMLSFLVYPEKITEIDNKIEVINNTHVETGKNTTIIVLKKVKADFLDTEELVKRIKEYEENE